MVVLSAATKREMQAQSDAYMQAWQKQLRQHLDKLDRNPSASVQRTAAAADPVTRVTRHVRQRLFRTATSQQVEQLVAAAATALTQLSSLLQAGKITPAQFTARAQELAQQQAQKAAALGFKQTLAVYSEPDDLLDATDADQSQLDSGDAQDYIDEQIDAGWIDDYADALGDAPSTAQVAAWSGTTMGIVWAGYQVGKAYAARSLGLTQAWWTLDPSIKDHCAACTEFADNSPYDLADLPTYPGLGDTDCVGNCRCKWDFAHASERLYRVWDEAAHPRAENGEFGAGGEAASQPTTIAEAYSPTVFASLTAQQRSAVLSYQDESYAVVNDHLRGVRSDAAKEFKSSTYAPMLAALDTVMAEHATPQATTVYRGAIASNADLFQPLFGGYQSAKDLVGKSFTDKAYASTTTEQKTALSFSGSKNQDSVVMQIEVPKGTPAMGMGGTGNERYTGEQELLLGRGTKFKIVAATLTQKPGGTGRMLQLHVKALARATK